MQMKEMEKAEFGGCLPITHVMWYYDTHLQPRKGRDSTAMFAFVDPVSHMTCKIASIEAYCLMYLLGVSTDRAAHWDNQVKLKLKHDLMHGERLDECGDWDKQANWINRVIALWVMDVKYGQAACDVKGKTPLPVEKGQDEPDQATGVKQKLTVQEPTLKKQKTAAKPTAGKDSKGDRRRGRRGG